MKIRTLVISVVIASFMIFSIAPRAKADPLTIMAVVGVSTVFLAATADQAFHEHEDDRDMRAEQKNGSENTTDAAGAEKQSASLAPAGGGVAR